MLLGDFSCFKALFEMFLVDFILNLRCFWWILTEESRIPFLLLCPTILWSVRVTGRNIAWASVIAVFSRVFGVDEVEALPTEVHLTGLLEVLTATGRDTLSAVDSLVEAPVPDDPHASFAVARTVLREEMFSLIHQVFAALLVAFIVLFLSDEDSSECGMSDVVLFPKSSLAMLMEFLLFYAWCCSVSLDAEERTPR